MVDADSVKVDQDRHKGWVGLAERLRDAIQHTHERVSIVSIGNIVLVVENIAWVPFISILVVYEMRE